MQDFRTRIEKLEVDAAECDLIANLACDDLKREAFVQLAIRYRELATALRKTVAEWPTKQNTPAG
jgi:hypothetical protein